MKKRTKITLRTKIYLTIVGLLALTGIIYAANPMPFSSGVPFPTGVAAAPDLLLVSEFCSENIDKIDCNGNASVFAMLPGFGSCREKYMATVPLTSGAPNNTFTPRDVFATEGPLVFRIDSTGTVTLFAALPGCLASDHNGITFDHFGTYGFDMIVTCHEGNVFRVNGAGTVTPIASLFPPGSSNVAEGPAVVPPGFGPHGGEIWVADEINGQIHAIGPPPTYTVTQNILPHVSAEGVFVIPNPPCSFCDSPPPGSAFFLAEQQMTQQIWRYPLSNFNMLGGNVILTSEEGASGADTSLVTVSGGSYVQSSFGPRVPGTNEGSSFVDCNVPTATPTPTPTATFTPTPTPTPSATFTPTPTPTPTGTPTCGTSFVIGDLDAVVGNKVTFWGAQWWKKNHLSGGTAPASFKGFANCTNPNPPTCGGTWLSDPGNSSHPPATVPADMTVIVSSLITKSGSIESGNIPMMVTIHTDPGYDPNPGHEGTGTVTAVVCQSARPGASQSGGSKTHHHASRSSKSALKRLLHAFRNH